MSDLLPVGLLLVIDQSITVVSLANLMVVLLVWMGEQSSAKRGKGWGPRTHPCGVPVFMMKVEELWPPILTFCHWFLMNAIIRKHNELPSQGFQASDSVCGMELLKDELKSTNNILR